MTRIDPAVAAAAREAGVNPYWSTDYTCPRCTNVGCCAHKPVCDYGLPCDVCPDDKPRAGSMRTEAAEWQRGGAR